MSVKAFLKFDYGEAMAIMMALIQMKEDLVKVSQNDTIPWTPEARQATTEILTATKSAIEKLHKSTGIKTDLPCYRDFDENEFLTKES